MESAVSSLDALAQADAAPAFTLVLPKSSPPVAFPFAGRLDDVSLPSLLLMLEGERKTGILALVLEPGRGKAVLYLLEGRVVRAYLPGRMEPRHAAAVCFLLPCSRGTFHFLPYPAIPGDDVGCSTTKLIVEGVRRLPTALAPLPGDAVPGSRLRRKSRRPRILRGIPGSRPGDEWMKDPLAFFFMACFVLLLLLAAFQIGPRSPGSPRSGILEGRSARQP